MLSVATGLLVVTLGGGTALGARPAATDLAASADVARSGMSVAPHAFPASSCQDFLACSGVTGTVGTNACNGPFACYHSSPWAGSVGNHACNGNSACDDVTGTVGTTACNGDFACNAATGRVGRYACNGASACYQASSSVAACANNLPGQVPAPCFQTRTVLVSSADPSVFGRAVALHATVRARFAAMGTPTGTFQFRVDGHDRGGPRTLDASGRASLMLSGLVAGDHWVSGGYLSDGSFTASSPMRLYQVVARAATQTAVSHGPSGAVAGQRLVLHARVTPLAPGVLLPQGTVQFVVDGLAVGLPRRLTGGIATLVLPDGLAAGRHTLRARYLGAPNFLASRSPSNVFVINR